MFQYIKTEDCSRDICDENYE